MKKTLNANPIVNELRGASVFFPAKAVEGKKSSITTSPLQADSSQASKARKASVDTMQPSMVESNRAASTVDKVSGDQPTNPPENQSTNRSTEQSTNRSANQSISRPINHSVDTSAILGKPKAFYVTQKQDEDLDTAVAKLNRQLGAKVPQKIDRSTLIRLLLEESDITSAQTISKLASRLVNRLISQLTS